MNIKTIVLAATIAVSGVAASAGGLSLPAGDTTVTPAPAPAPVQRGSLGAILPIVGIAALLLLVSQNNSSGS